MGGASSEAYDDSKYKSTSQAQAASRQAHKGIGINSPIKLRDSGKKVTVSGSAISGQYADQGDLGNYYKDLYGGKYDGMMGQETRTVASNLSEYQQGRGGDGPNNVTRTHTGTDQYGTKSYEYSKQESYYYNVGDRGRQEAAAAGVTDRGSASSPVQVRDSGANVKHISKAQSKGKGGAVNVLPDIQL